MVKGIKAVMQLMVSRSICCKIDRLSYTLTYEHTEFLRGQVLDHIDVPDRSHGDTVSWSLWVDGQSQSALKESGRKQNSLLI